ncbi:MAG: hypothetical protein US86_C0007G0088 [Candidatus Daviesbacteria bacterium GW2011_GWA2_38_24]|uniref:Uncharacterized protein n=1 Tax=Candidatus Daviesbacteria bacterium GW2011_GWA2_38_24 TaxID=1618422 RepID=A0A0G0JEE1_9BACT|nr:MAG: hypothetical protein US86_C0007G0088 [Candidatus Daviesbacteria bacterium GW2011_GWA2_38_24]OGE22695.1 MAG: hypothetical protein A2688_02810 [Candidatus Daviesbacteria bacterium RIFCSPHIGHO2_01_FULL_38_8]
METPTTFPQQVNDLGVNLEQLSQKLKGCEEIEGTFFVPKGTKQYEELHSLLTEIFKNLNQDQGLLKTHFLGRDPNEAKKALSEISDLMEGKKTWDEILWVFNRGSLELFKTELAQDSPLSSALCYNIDLGWNRALQKPSIVVERIFASKTGNKITLSQDGKFTIKEKEIIVDTNSLPLHVH